MLLVINIELQIFWFQDKVRWRLNGRQKTQKTLNLMKFLILLDLIGHAVLPPHAPKASTAALHSALSVEPPASCRPLLASAAPKVSKAVLQAAHATCRSMAALRAALRAALQAQASATSADQRHSHSQL